MGKFNGFGGGGGNMAQLMRQAQQMQRDMLAKQEELKNTQFTAQAGGGMVEVTLTGEKKIVSLKIKPEAVDPDDVEMLEDLIVAALQDGFNAVDKKTAEIMGPYSGMIGGGGF
ncbi:MAG: YbaB/EbfC family nucleoid-associated protein [Clostridia bacterium]|nr:YbaB/EbfC family nucleoid-associated protein [Clostridia bacterium]